MQEHQFYTPDEVADLFRVTRKTVYHWLSTGQLRSVRPAGRWIITRHHLDTFANVPGRVKPAGGRSPGAAPAPSPGRTAKQKKRPAARGGGEPIA